MQTQRHIILVPTYNERENIAGLLDSLTTLYPEKEIWIIDDNSPDGTSDFVEFFLKSHPQVKLIKREGKGGLGAAYKHALSIIQGLPDVHAVLTMDADGSHDPKSVGALFSALENADIAIGSRYVKGGRIDGWDRKRILLSWGGNLYVRTLTRFPIKDSTAGFNAFRKSILDKIDLKKISSFGYSYQIEFKNAALEAGATFKEVPITFTERRRGRSKVSRQIVIEGILTPLHLLLERARQTDLQKYAVGLFMIFTLFFATYKLTESPSVWFDEGLYFQVANHISQGEIDGFVVFPGQIERVPELSVGYPLTYPLALVLKVFGSNILVARLFMALCIMTLVIMAYLLSKRSFVGGLPLLALALIATFPPLYGNGKSVLGEVPGLVYLLFSLFFLKKHFLILTGLFLGLTIATKPIFILLLPALILAAFIAWRRREISLKNIAIITAGAILPIFVWILVQFGGAPLSEIFRFYANPQPGGGLAVIANNAKHFFSDIGLLYLTLATIFWIWSAWTRVRWKIRIDMPELMAFIFTLLIIAAYLRTAGHYRYLFPAQIVSLIYLPLSLSTISGSIRARMNLSSLFETTLIPILVTALFLAGTYQLMFNSWVADFYGSHKTEFWTKYFEGPPPKNALYYNVPEIAMFVKNNNYSQYLELSPSAGIFVGEENKLLLKEGYFDTVFIETAYYEGMKQELAPYYTVSEGPVYKYVILKRI